jgi:hypothetical protein
MTRLVYGGIAALLASALAGTAKADTLSVTGAFIGGEAANGWASSPTPENGIFHIFWADSSAGSAYGSGWDYTPPEPGISLTTGGSQTYGIAGNADDGSTDGFTPGNAGAYLTVYFSDGTSLAIQTSDFGTGSLPTSATMADGGQYVTVSNFTWDGVFFPQPVGDNFPAGGNGSITYTDPSTGATWFYPGPDYAGAFTGSVGSFTVSVTPEPASLGLLLGAGAIALARPRRRRKA